MSIADSIIPKFRVGQRVRVRPQVIERPCSKCRCTVSCAPLLQSFEDTVIDGFSSGIMCPECNQTFFIPAQGTVTLKGPNFAAPWTWLEPLEEVKDA